MLSHSSQNGLRERLTFYISWNRNAARSQFFLKALNQRQSESFTCVSRPPASGTARHYIIIKKHYNGHLNSEREEEREIVLNEVILLNISWRPPIAWEADPLLSLWGSKPAHLWSGTVGGRLVRWHLIMCLSALLLVSCVCLCVCNSSLRDDVSGFPNCRVIRGCVRPSGSTIHVWVCVCPQVIEWYKDSQVCLSGGVCLDTG